MRGHDRPQSTMLTLVNPEQRVPAHHPIRLIKALAEVALKELSPLFEQMYSEVGRPSMPPERLLKASLLMRLRIGARLMGRVLAPLAVEVDAGIARIIGRPAIGGLLTFGAQALKRCPRLDQSPVHRKVLVAGQPQLARLRDHSTEKLARHIMLEQARPIAAKGAMVEGRLVPVQVEEPAKQQVIVQLLAEHPLAAHRIQRRGSPKKVPVKRPSSVTPRAC